MELCHWHPFSHKHVPTTPTQHTSYLSTQPPTDIRAGASSFRVGLPSSLPPARSAENFFHKALQKVLAEEVMYSLTHPALSSYLSTIGTGEKGSNTYTNSE